jgi:NAD+ diphosphatase
VNTGVLAWLFQGASLIMEEGVPDTEMAGGTALETILGAFKDPEIFEIPPVDGSGPTTGVSIPADYTLPAGWKAAPVRQGLSALIGGAAEDLPREGGFPDPIGRMLRACHISQWRAESRFCGSCGAKNGDSPDELARLCPACGRMEFPRIAPAVITIVINDAGEALLAHNKKFTPGVYSLVAGFNEAGESLERTVAREIREEVNIEVRDIRYIASQPWPFPNSLMLGFTARYASGTLCPDGIEIEDAQWFPRDKLPKLPGHGSVSRYLINRWTDGKFEL